MKAAACIPDCLDRSLLCEHHGASCSPDDLGRSMLCDYHPARKDLVQNLSQSKGVPTTWRRHSWVTIAWSCCFAGGRLISTPDYPEPLRNSMTDADGQPLRRDMWPRRNVSNPSVIPHRTSALPEPLQNSLADAEYLDTRARR